MNLCERERAGRVWLWRLLAVWAVGMMGGLAGAPGAATAQVLSAAQQDGKWGFIDTLGAWVIPPRFDSVEVDPLRRPDGWNGFAWRSFEERNYARRSFMFGAARVRDGKRWGAINAQGQLVVPADFDSVESLASAFSRNHQPVEVFRVALADKGKKHKWGLISPKGEVKLYYDFDRIEPFENGLAWVRKGKKWGQVNVKGEMVVPFQLESKGAPESYFKGYAIVEQDGKKGMITQRGGIVMPFEFDDLNYPVDGYILFKQAGRWGVADDSGRVRVPPQYDAVEFQVSGYFRVQQGKLWGLAHVDRQLVLPVRYERVRYTGRELIWAFQNGMWGAFGLDGQQRMDFKVEYFEACEEGNYLVQRNSRWGLVSDQGYLVQDYVHQKIDCAEDGYAQIRRDSKFGLVNRQGRLIVPAQYDSIQPPIYNVIWVRTDGRWGAFDTTGQLAHPARFERQQHMGGFVALAREMGRYGAIDCRTGQLIAECKFDSYDTLPGGRVRLNGAEADLLIDTAAHVMLADQGGKILPLGRRLDLYVVRKDDKSGLVDTAGRQQSAPKYDDIRHDPRSLRYLPVKLGSGWGVWDLKTAKNAVPVAYEDVHLIDEQYAACKSQGRWSVVSIKTGLTAFAGAFDRIGELRNGLLAVAQGQRWGLVDTTGVERVPPLYGDVKPLTANWIAVRSPNEDRWGILDQKGKLALRMEIEKIPELREGYIWFWFKGQERILDPNGRYDLAVARPLGHGRIAVWKEPNWMLVVPGRQPAKPLLFRQLLPYYEAEAGPDAPAAW